MPDINYSAIAGRLLRMPITGLSIWCNSEAPLSGGNHLNIYQVEQESSFNLDPKTRKSFHGPEITLGYDFKATIYVLDNMWDKITLGEVIISDKNLLEDLEHVIQDYKQGFQPQIFIGLGRYPGNPLPNMPENIINSDSSAVIQLSPGKITSLKYRIESINYRPRLIIDVSAWIKDPLTEWFGEQFINIVRNSNG